jgi:methylenetetrahydrofolate reductase (NADPH)
MDKHNNDPRFSFEFFPPRTDVGVEKLRDVHRELAALQPDFFSVTYGAGGSTRDGTRQTVTAVKQAGSDVAPHLSFGGSSKEDIASLLNDYRNMGINRLVALRGDIPSGTGVASQYFYANELIEFVRKTTGDHFHIEVACYPEIHPQSDSYDSDLKYFKNKVNAGADSAITQYFYNPDAYFYLWMPVAKLASTSRLCPASCQSPTSPACSASATIAAPKSRAGFGSAYKPMAMTATAFVTLVSKLYRRFVKTCWLAALRVCTFTP